MRHDIIKGESREDFRIRRSHRYFLHHHRNKLAVKARMRKLRSDPEYIQLQRQRQWQREGEQMLRTLYPDDTVLLIMAGVNL